MTRTEKGSDMPTTEAPPGATPSRNVRVGPAWDVAKTTTVGDGLTVTDVVRAAIDDYLAHRAAGTWPSWLPRP